MPDAVRRPDGDGSIDPASDPAFWPGPAVRNAGDGHDVTTFTVWAPAATTVHVTDLTPPGHRTESQRADSHRAESQQAGSVAPTGPIEMRPVAGGYWVAEVAGVGHGWRYRYSIDGGASLPDPASGWQPDGVHGASAVVDTARFGGTFEWTDHGWRGIDLADTVLYEMHVGTFTPAGTFDAAVEQLPRLAALGITTIEVMPVNAVPGERNWGYDGVFAYAVQHAYGGPEAFARFVDAAHARGLAVVLDVVYNHLGPEGNVLWQFGPYFTDSYVTPWGPAVNVAGHDSDAVRQYIVGNVRRWVRHFHLDGFRLDAVHAVVDPTANPLWEQVASAAHDEGRAARRTVVVVAESSDNDARYVRSTDRGGYGLDGVWNDDVHHAIRVAVTGERRGWYADYDGTAEELADTVEHRWKFRGRHSTYRRRRHGRPVDDVAPHRFVSYWLNHDQIGNRPAGDRPLLDAVSRRMAPAVVILLPSTPMLFMGEEYGDPAPFPFFVDHGDPDILDATRRGRRAEFADADWGVEVPDPGDPATMAAAVVDPTMAEREPHRSLLAMYTELLRLRRDVPPVASPAARQRVARHETVVEVTRQLPANSDGPMVSSLLINLGDAAATVVLGAEHGGRDVVVAFDSTDPRWSGAESEADTTDPLPTHAAIAPDRQTTVPARSVVLVTS